jgi:hypothetical protein
VVSIIAVLVAGAAGGFVFMLALVLIEQIAKKGGR